MSSMALELAGFRFIVSLRQIVVTATLRDPRLEVCILEAVRRQLICAENRNRGYQSGAA